jgi:3-methylcrotonyl-CoA carboxylase alpha subunit
MTDRAATDNWRLGGPAPLDWHFEWGGADHTVSLQMTAGGWRTPSHNLRLVSRDAHSLLVEIDGRQIAAHLHADGVARWLQIGGERWRVRALGPFGRPPVRKDMGAARTSVVLAPMPGRIVAVLVNPGDVVAPGQIVLRLEAMKMEHNLGADIAGEVSGVLVGTGDQVVEGAELIGINAAPSVAT